MNKIISIVKKDILTEFRTKEIFPTMLIFSFLILLIFHFSFEIKSNMLPNTASAILWVTFIFSGLLALSRSFSLEKENDAIVSLVLTPADKSLIYTGKFISNLILILLMELIVIPLFFLFFPP